MNVADIMTTSIHTITSDKSVAHAAERMNEHRIGSLIVVDHGDVIGIMTSRDVRASHPNRIVADAMTPQPIYMSANQNIWEAHSIMEEHDIERVLIMAEDGLAGLITRESILMKITENMDPLTGLFRAPYIQTIGEQFLKEQTPFHLLFIDLNNFGKINKQYGHPFGDDVICTYSHLLESMLDKEHDYLSRYAGDEFVIISTGDNVRINSYIAAIEQPIEIHNVQVSAAVGHIDGYQDPKFLSCPLRELLEKASLLSSSTKTRSSLS